MTHRKIAVIALTTIITGLIVTAGIGCIASDDDRIAEVETEVTIPGSFYDDPTRCYAQPGSMTLYWHIGGYCGVMRPTDLCSMLFDQSCMAANPRLNWLLQSVCWRRCWNVSYTAQEPAKPPSCNPPCYVTYGLDGSFDDDGYGN